MKHYIYLVNSESFSGRNELKYSRIVGSTIEGSVIANLFYPDEKTVDRLRREVDIDVEILVLNFPLKYKHCIIDIPDKPGFLRVNLKRTTDSCICLKCCHTKESNSYHHVQDRMTGFIMPYEVKKLFMKNNKEITERNLILSFLLNTFKEYFSLSNSNFEITKASYSEQHDIYINSQYLVTVHTDVAFIMRIEWQSTVLKQWIERKRKWPNIDDLSDELNRSFIIAKPSFQEKLNAKTTEMRYSFANLEHKIFQMQSQTQRLVYLIAKCLLKR